MVVSTWTHADEAKTNAKYATATVIASKCVFEFPIDDIERDWEWGVSPANYCEYSWMVTIKRGIVSYQIGFSYFNPDSMPESGSLAELLATGQSDVWKRSADAESGSVVEGLRVTCTATRKHLRISLDNTKWTVELFCDKPESVTFETGGTQLEHTKTIIEVAYKPPFKNLDR